MSFNLTQNFLANARGINFVDGGGVTWTFNPSTNTVTATASGGGGGSGTVTSVGLTAASTHLVVTGSTITASGSFTVDLATADKANIALAATALQSVSLTDASTTPIFTTGVTAGALTETLKTQSANTVFAGPASGSAAQPSFRTLLFSDFPVGIPAAIPDLQLWWTSSNIQASAGTAIFRFEEQTPWINGPINGPPAGFTSAVVIDATLLNGLPLAKWPGSGNASSAIPLLVPQVLVNGTTFFAVVKGNSAVAAQAMIGGTAGSLAFYLNNSAGASKIGLTKTNAASIGTATAAWVAGTAFQCNATYNPTTGAFAFRQGRTTNGSGTGVTAAGGTLASAAVTTNWLGADLNASTNTNGGSVGELIIYNRILTLTEIQAVEAYLLAKWGV